MQMLFDKMFNYKLWCALSLSSPATFKYWFYMNAIGFVGNIVSNNNSLNRYALSLHPIYYVAITYQLRRELERVQSQITSTFHFNEYLGRDLSLQWIQFQFIMAFVCCVLDIWIWIVICRECLQLYSLNICCEWSWLRLVIYCWINVKTITRRNLELHVSITLPTR